MKKYNFENIVHIDTDLVGSRRNTWISVGMEYYPIDDSHIDEYKYLSFDEVKDLYERGLTTDNLFLNDKGEFQLKSSHLSAITVFSVINGIAFNVEEDDKNLLDYAIKIGVVHSTPQPVEMISGVKNMEILSDDSFKFTYKVQPEKLGYLDNNFRSHNTLKELIIGSLKRALSFHKKLNIISYDYDSSKLELSVVIPKDSLLSRDEVFTSVLKKLDLQIHYFFHSDVDWYHHLQALMQCARDQFQFHLINEDINEMKSNFEWYRKDFK